MTDKLHNQLMMKNKFEVLKAIVGNHLAEVEINQGNSGAEIVLFLHENYRFLERHVKYLPRANDFRKRIPYSNGTDSAEGEQEPLVDYNTFNIYTVKLMIEMKNPYLVCDKVSSFVLTRIQVFNGQ